MATATAHSTPTEALAGLVERVTFHNAENGFCVLRVKARGHKDLVTVVGHAATIGAGEWVRYSSPDPAGATYVAVCLPAFAPDTVHRDD